MVDPKKDDAEAKRQAKEAAEAIKEKLADLGKEINQWANKQDGKDNT